MSKDQHKRLHAVMQRACLHSQRRKGSVVRLARAARLARAFLRAKVS
jgi:hypothetical protein